MQFRIDERLRSHIPALKPDEYLQLEQNILAHGCQSPLIVWDDVLLDGHNRYEICNRHGVPFRTETVNLPDFEAATAWIEENQLGRRNLTADQFAYYIGQKYERLKKAQGAPEGNANRCVQSHQNDGVERPRGTADVVARQHGIGPATVERAAAFARDVNTAAAVFGDDARAILLSGEEKLSRRDVADIASIAQEAKEQDLEFSSPREGLEHAKAVHHHRTTGTGNNEWYTPAKYVEAARAVLGTINLDPASSEIANRTVRAERFYTTEDDGLAQPWHGNVWMNPPYAQPLIAHFMAKLVDEAEKGTIRQAIALTHNHTDTAWFQSTAPAADAVCFTRGRIAFLNPDSSIGASPTQGQAFFYFGPNTAMFAETFQQFGWVVKGGAG
jgi:phage N-6-adenine-methyltransferase